MNGTIPNRYSIYMYISSNYTKFFLNDHWILQINAAISMEEMANNLVNLTSQVSTDDFKRTANCKLLPEVHLIIFH